MSKSKSKPAAKSAPKPKLNKREAPKVDVITPAVESRTAEAPAAGEVVTTAEQNGIKRPGADTLCGRVWQTLDDLRTAGVDATAKNARDALKDAGMADATVRTQFARWRKFHSTVDAS